MQKKISLNNVLYAAVILLALVVLAAACLGSNQASPSFFLPVRLIGEYSYDGGQTWSSLEENTGLSALDGDLILCGNFEREFPEGVQLNFYLDHITMEIFVNGEQSFWDCRLEMGLTSSGCGKQWVKWITPEISENDVIEFRLGNSHKIGNRDAYNELLGSIYGGTDDLFSSFMMKSGNASRIIGFSVIVVAVMLLAAAVSFWLLRIEGGGELRNLGLLALFFGGYFILDTVDLSLWSENIAFNSYALNLCIMLAGLSAIMSAAGNLKSGAVKVARGAVIASSAVNVCLLLLSLCGVMVIYDTSIYWVFAHLALFPVMLGCCVYELIRGKDRNYMVLISHVLLFTSFLADMIGCLAGIYKTGICSKAVFLVLFLINLVIFIKDIPADFRAARQAEKLEAELADSRISIMLSQIQPHFLYNSLNSIYYLCDKDPKAARQAISDFSDYLRGNMDSLTRSAPVPFYRELKHLKNYLTLEKLRFDDTLEIVWDIQTEDFMIPALTVQPLVENAVKHGICKSENGGTVTISTRECESCYEVEIRDDGAGFDPNEKPSDGKSHVGIENVRSRLSKMCGADLEITSEKGKGTTAIIRIPKNKEQGE